MKYEALHAIKHDGKRIAPGETIDLTEKEAAPLISAGAVKPKAEKSADKPTEKAGKA